LTELKQSNLNCSTKIAKMKAAQIIFASIALFYLRNVESKHWALVIAGSNGWYNYRHQADACHAYQILNKHGIPEENIVVMMYDDIANNRENPTRGKIINMPNGPDVYEGVPKDYTKEEVTPENFLNILQGNKDKVKGGSGKVIDSGPDDHIFVFFTDHGAPGLIAFPDSELHASQLQEALVSMNQKQRYKQMVLYIEACESGSMFNRHRLPTNINVFATTAANGVESSYACYYDKKRQTYLGDVYSVKWMENSDKANFLQETLESQFDVVKKETNTSHVMQFGDMNISKEPIGDFQGNAEIAFDNTTKHYTPVPIVDAIPSPDVPLNIMYNKLREVRTSQERDQVLTMINDEHKMRKIIKSTVRDVVERLVSNEHKQHRIINTPATPTNMRCYENAVTKFRTNCFNFNKYEHALRHVYVLSNLCDEGLHMIEVERAIEKSCFALHQQYTH